MAGIEVELVDSMGSDLSVVNAARCSMGKEKREMDAADVSLINYLKKHRHDSPFFHAVVTVRAKVPIFVERQIFKHQIGFCLTGDTLIKRRLADGGVEHIQLDDLYNRWNFGKECKQKSSTGKVYSRKFSAEQEKQRITKWQVFCADLDSSKIITSTIQDVFYSGEKECFKITDVENKSISASDNHPFLTKTGWVQLKDLKPGMEIAKNGVKYTGTGDYQDKQKLETLVKELGDIQSIADATQSSYHTIRKWLRIHGLQGTTRKGHAAWNKGVSGYKTNRKPETEEKRDLRLSKIKRGEDSHLYRHGQHAGGPIVWMNTVRKEVFKKFQYTCQYCGEKGGRLVNHHIFPRHSHPELAMDINNLATVHDTCHRKIHKTTESERQFAEEFLNSEIKQDFTRKLGQGNTKKIKWVKIKSIKSIGKQKVYDIEMGHKDHNFVANGFIVHNSYNSISLRYVEPPNEFFTFNILRKGSASIKQGSLAEPVEQEAQMQALYDYACRKAFTIYDKLLLAGVCKEQARAVLPLSTMTEFICTGSLAAWARMYNLRSKPDAQRETAEYARQVGEIITPLFPVSWGALTEQSE